MRLVALFERGGLNLKPDDGKHVVHATSRALPGWNHSCQGASQTHSDDGVAIDTGGMTAVTFRGVWGMLSPFEPLLPSEVSLP